MWRSRLFWRLFGSSTLLLILSFGLLGWLLIDRIETRLLHETQRSLESKTLLISALVQKYFDQAANLDLQQDITRLGDETHMRITLIRSDGVVLADSGEQPSKMENHRNRDEVQQAEQNGLGVSTRYSGTLHRPMMYVARRLPPGSVGFIRVALPLDTVVAEIRWLRQLVWTVTGLTLLLALLLSVLLTQRVTVPVVELANAADAIAQGDYGKTVYVAATDEIGMLATSFNTMSTACAKQIAQMSQDREQLRAVFRSMVEGVLVLDAEQHIVLVNDAACRLLGISLTATKGQKVWQILRNRQLTDAIDKILSSDEPHRQDIEWTGTQRSDFALQGARLPGVPHRGAVLVFHDITHLRKLENLRQDFVANVSHELKTPLAAIQAMVETLLDGALHDVNHNVRFLERIRENANRLHRLVQDLLTIGRIESSQAPLEIASLALLPTVEACVQRHIERAKSKGQQLCVGPESRPAQIFADEDALAEILDNLVDNAIKYTPVGGSITLTCRAESQQAVLEVRDTGTGIPEKDLPRVFERFYRVDKARSRELGGTGLGLSIVKHLVQSLGGTISAQSEVGVGSKFTISLPLATAQVALESTPHSV